MDLHSHQRRDHKEAFSLDDTAFARHPTLPYGRVSDCYPDLGECDWHVWIPPEQIPGQVFGRYLYPLENSVRKLIGQTLELGGFS